MMGIMVPLRVPIRCVATHGAPFAFTFTGSIMRVLVDISDAEFQDLVVMAKVAMGMQ